MTSAVDDFGFVPALWSPSCYLFVNFLGVFIIEKKYLEIPGILCRKLLWNYKVK